MNAFSSPVSCGLFLRIATARSAADRSGNPRVHGEVGEDLLPEVRQVIVDDGRRNEPGVDHFEQVVVFEAFGRGLDVDGGLPGCLEHAAHAGRLS